MLGCLVEKQLTTPQQYPLTLNALMLACNQSSNRFPIVSYDERSVEAAVTNAKTRGFARLVHPSHGRSAIRFAHTLEEAIGLDSSQLALLAVMMLRGPQTLGELRSRTERMVRFEDLSEIERELGRLAERADPLVLRLQRQPGQKEDRFAHLLGGPVQSVQSVQSFEEAAPRRSAVESAHLTEDGAEPGSPVARDAPSMFEQGLAELRNDVAGLRGELADLRHQLEDLRSELGA